MFRKAPLFLFFYCISSAQSERPVPSDPTQLVALQGFQLLHRSPQVARKQWGRVSTPSNPVQSYTCTLCGDRQGGPKGARAMCQGANQTPLRPAEHTSRVTVVRF